KNCEKQYEECVGGGGVIIGLQCFTFSSENEDALTWEEARNTCASKGGQLATLQDPEAVMAYVIDNYDGKLFWAGGSDNQDEGRWVWVNGDTMGEQFPWMSNEPNNHDGLENCLLVNWNDYGYNDLDCNRKHRYICNQGTASTNTATTSTEISTTFDTASANTATEATEISTTSDTASTNTATEATEISTTSDTASTNTATEATEISTTSDTQPKDEPIIIHVRPIPEMMVEKPFAPPVIEEVDALVPDDAAEASRQKRSWWQPISYYSDYSDALKMFDLSGLYILSDLTVETRPCKQRELEMVQILNERPPALTPARFTPRPPPLARPPPTTTTTTTRTPPTTTTPTTTTRTPPLKRPLPPMANEPTSTPASTVSPLPIMESKFGEKEKSRTYFPETWLWDILP
ncbi:unnamed protein product, partial [Meganyctiphanes norvegica]